VDINELKTLGWTERNSSQRDIPDLDNYKDFLRAYFELHARLGYCTQYKRRTKEKYYALRLRIYGNHLLIQSICTLLHQLIGVGMKSAQDVGNEKTSYIAYTAAAEVFDILDWITGTPRHKEYWQDIDKKLSEPTKRSLDHCL
jgi:hypothetical protein